MPQGVIDMFEVVQIEKQQREHLFIAVGTRDGLLQSVVEKGTIRKPCQGIMIRQVPYRSGCLLEFRDIAYDSEYFFVICRDDLDFIKAVCVYEVLEKMH